MRSEAAAASRTVLLSGTFSIEEIDVTTKSRKKTAAVKKTKVVKASKKCTARKKVATQKVASKKTASKKKVTSKSANKKTANKKTASKKAASKPSVGIAAGVVVLHGLSDFKNVLELKNQLSAAEATADTVIIDAAELESIDAAALQLLAAFANTMRANQKSLEWKQATDTLRDVAKLLDMDQAIGLDDATLEDDEALLCPVF